MISKSVKIHPFFILIDIKISRAISILKILFEVQVYKFYICTNHKEAISLIRTIVILFVAWGIVLARGEAKGISTLSKHNLLFLVISGIATGLSWVFYFKALQLGKVSQVAPVDKLSVALTIVLSIVFLGEALTIKTAIGAVLIILGTLVLIL